MTIGAAVSTTIAAFLTLCIFSFLYRDNPFYKLAEHLMVGVSAGYWVAILYTGTFIPNLWQRLAAGKWWYVLPLLLGLMMWTRLIRRWSWISRYPLAFYLGIGAGAAVPLEMQTKVIQQLYGTVQMAAMLHTGHLQWLTVLNTVLITLGIIACLVYFFFSKAHTGVIGGIAQVGIWTLMIGFGASFGYTVMARISLLIDRIQFLVNDWLLRLFS